MIYMLTFKMGSEPLNVDEPKQYKTEESQVEKVGTSTASLKEERAAVTDKSSSETSIRSKASKTTVKSETGSDISPKINTDASPKVCTTVIKD